MVDRRKFIKSGSVVAAFTMTAGCSVAVIEDAFKEYVDIIKDPNDPALKSRLNQSPAGYAIQKQAGDRIDKASQLITPYAGMPAANYTQALRLYQQNFSQRVFSANADLWALSKLFWAELLLGETPQVRYSQRDAITSALEEAFDVASVKARRQVMIEFANAGMTAACLKLDYQAANRWFDEGVRYQNFVPAHVHGNELMASLRRSGLHDMYSAGACLAARAGDATTFWQRLEVAQSQSRNAGIKRDKVENAKKIDVASYLGQCLEGFDAIIGISIGGADAHFAISYKSDKRIKHYFQPLKTPQGGQFDQQTLEWLLYGSTFRQTFIRGGMSGWMGSYAAMNSHTGAHNTLTTFADNLENNSANHWDYLIESIDQSLNRLGINTGARVAIIAPDDISMLPLRIASPGRGKPRLMDRYIVHSAPNTKSLAISVTKSHRNDISMFGLFNPTGDLKNAALEESYIENLLNLKRLEKSPAGLSPKRFVKNMASVDARYIYLSTHGKSIGTESSGIYLGANKFLSNIDVINSRGGLTADLVIMSSCELGATFINNKPEPASLPTAFLRKGAKGVIAALWRVEVSATALLMTRFLELHFANGIEAATALGEAQKWMSTATSVDFQTFVMKMYGKFSAEDKQVAGRVLAHLNQFKDSDRPYSNPVYWGAFVFIGS